MVTDELVEVSGYVTSREGLICSAFHNAVDVLESLRNLLSGTDHEDAVRRLASDLHYIGVGSPEVFNVDASLDYED